MPLNNNFKFSCSAMPTINGHELKNIKPDADGAYEVVVGAVGCPTRNNVIYDTESLIQAMNEPSGRFNICLRDGNLSGEYGHPVIKTKDDLNRLMLIDEKYISHYFTKIWVDDKPIMLHGLEGYPIRAKVVPTGPYGETLKKQLEDPHHNTAFSIRSLCLPMQGNDNRYEYRRVQIVVTFDAVHAPGFEIASKRYVGGTESFSEVNVDYDDVKGAIDSNVTAGMESVTMANINDLNRIAGKKKFTMNGVDIGSNTTGNVSIMDTAGNIIHAASLMYRRK